MMNQFIYKLFKYGQPAFYYSHRKLINTVFRKKTLSLLIIVWGWGLGELLACAVGTYEVKGFVFKVQVRGRQVVIFKRFTGRIENAIDRHTAAW